MSKKTSHNLIVLNVLAVISIVVHSLSDWIIKVDRYIDRELPQYYKSLKKQSH